MERLPFKDRVKRLGLLNFKRRRIREDMIWAYKIMVNIEKITQVVTFTPSHNKKGRL